MAALTAQVGYAQEARGTASTAPRAEAIPPIPSEPPRLSALRYDFEYPVIGYSGKAVNNRVARLQAALESRAVHLEFKAPRGYLDSLLRLLAIDPSSQTLVYSKSSLQIAWIKASTPRAIYCNDDTYVAWVQGSGLLELVTMDSALGPVFYTLSNRNESVAGFDREVLRCLACHDKFSLGGGGVPLFLVMSSSADINGLLLGSNASSPVSDDTPIAARWGGWYVTGRHDNQVHLGNILVHSEQELAHLDRVRRGNLDTLDGLLDTRPYLTNTSDIVALLVLEHETTVYNLITRINFKARSVVARELPAQGAWADVSPKTRMALEKMMEPLVQAMLFVDAASISGRITGTSGFDVWFQGQGPRDGKGRSLRDLDLKTRLFKYPLSYLVYSAAFDGLPDYARDYIFRRFADILGGRDQSDALSHVSAADRAAVAEILASTKPDFARVAARASLTAVAR